MRNISIQPELNIANRSMSTKNRDYKFRNWSAGKRAKPVLTQSQDIFQAYCEPIPEPQEKHEKFIQKLLNELNQTIKVAKKIGSTNELSEVMKDHAEKVQRLRNKLNREESQPDFQEFQKTPSRKKLKFILDEKPEIKIFGIRASPTHKRAEARKF